MITALICADLELSILGFIRQVGLIMLLKFLVYKVRYGVFMADEA